MAVALSTLPLAMARSSARFRATAMKAFRSAIFVPRSITGFVIGQKAHYRQTAIPDRDLERDERMNHQTDAG